MANTNDCWGIEVGVSALKAMRLVKTGGEVALADYEIIPHKQVLTTPDLDVDEATQLALDALTSKHDLSKSKVVVSVPGNRAFARFAKLPPVEPKKIPDIVRFEAVQQIPFPIEQVEWDYQVFQQEDSPDVEVGIFAITKERIAGFLRNYRSQGLNIDEVTLSPVGVFNAFAHEGLTDDEEEGTIIMDIGGVSTDLIIVEGGGIWLRTLPIGGANFTEALVKAFKLSYRKAEKLKREAATSKYARQIFQAMRPVFSDLVQEVQKSLGYYQSLNRDSNLTKVMGLGSTFRLPGLQKFLKQQLQMEVTRPSKFQRLSIEGKREADFADNAMNLATVYGLALQGLGESRVTCNLLPGHLLRQRMWKAKQPVFAAAAALLAVAAGVGVFSLINTRAKWQQAAADTDQRYQQVVPRANRLADEYRDINRASDPRVQIENVRGILDYRDLSAGVLRDLTMALETVNVDPVLYQANYEAMAELPANQRQRLYITAIDSNYLGTAAASAGEDDRRGGGEAAIGDLRAPEAFWPQAGGGGQPPTYEVVVRGFIDANETTAAQILSEGVVRWLEQNTNRVDRPYTLRVGRSPIRRLTTEAGEETDARDGRGGDRFTGRTPGRFESPDPAGSRFGAGEGREQSRTGRASRSRVSEVTSWEGLAPLLPENPLDDLIEYPVTAFTLRWEVQLRPPAEARNPAAAVEAMQQQDAEGQPGGASPTGPEAAAPQPRADEEAAS